MKIAVLFDSISDDMSPIAFDAIVNTFISGGHEIKVLCRGCEGREGDRYDILRNRTDVIWSNGMPPLIEAELKFNWKPDITINNSNLYQYCMFYNKAIPL